MNHTPEVTVLMPVYNGARYLRQAVESILSQTYADFEFLIVDDGSTDDSADIVASYRDPRIRLVRRTGNLGLIATLNEGLGLAGGEFVARMDADDIAHPERLERQLALLAQNPDLVLVGSDVEIIDEQGTLIGYEPKPTSDASLRVILSVICAIAHPTVVFRKEAVLRVGGYAEAFHAAEDYELWTRLAAVGKLGNLPLPLLKYRINPQGESLRKTALQEANSRVISDREWARYGTRGPAPSEGWGGIWPDRRRLQHPRRNELRFYANLHRRFAGAYCERGQVGEALKHHLGAIRWQCDPREDVPAICNMIRSVLKLRFKRQRPR